MKKRRSKKIIEILVIGGLCKALLGLSLEADCPTNDIKNNLLNNYKNINYENLFQKNSEYLNTTIFKIPQELYDSCKRE